MINYTLIEAMVSPGLRRKPEFVWGAEANDPKTIIGHMAEGKAVLPHLSGEPTRLSEEIGLAFIVGNTFDRSRKSCWPTSELQRVATIAMQMGYEVAALQEYLPHTAQYLTSYMERVRDAEVSNPQLRSIQSLCMSAVLAANLQANEHRESDLFKLAAEILDGYIQEPAHQAKVNQIMAMAVSGECIARTTEDFARIAESLFEAQGKNFEPEDDDEHDQQQGSDSDQGKGKPETKPQNGPAEDSMDGSDESVSSSQAGEAGQAEGADEQEGLGQQQADPQGNDGAVDKTANQQDQGNESSAEAQQGSQTQQTGGSSQEKSQSAGGSDPDDKPEEGQEQTDRSSQHAAEEMKADSQQACDGEAQPEGDASQSDDPVAFVFGNGAGGVNDGQFEGKPQNDLDTYIDGRLVTAIVKTFQNTRVRDTGYRSSGGRLDVRRAMRIPQGETKVFKTRQVTQGMEMAMTVLVDRSGSMKKCLQEVCKTALSFAIGLSRITNTKTRVAAFPAAGLGATTMVLEYGENHKHARQRLERISAGGSTPLAQAIIAEAQVLLQRKERRKVITVLTDGKPDDGHQVLAAIRWAKKEGIEVVGIGFGDAHNIHNWIEHSTYAQSLSQLPNAIEKIFEEKILKAA